MRKVVHELNRWPSTRALKVHTGPYGHVGTPDIIGCCNGFFFALEAKRIGNKPTVIQWAELQKWESAGAVSGYFTTAAEAFALVRPLLTR